ncbi:sensor histidine kinase [Bacillus atrophaeus]|uniref:sensor histidine kinase n=1 Tax=Bacillus atrophaeus TaxID=1452 RepID=UPI002280AF7F|nr:HAMP domain-containing sensor histidine kinase [Bacillus atrophaeus]MCY8921207.1 HAMP domain-containing histidine kinase [Bacillus atrophaeus]
MKWRLTGRYMISVIVVAILIVIINLSALLVWLFAQANFNTSIGHDNENSAETFTRSFQKYLTVTNGEVTISREGKQALKDRNAWVQILDEKGEELYSYRQPQGLKKEYTPIEIVDMHKYMDKKLLSTIFAGGKKISEQEYSYFIGFKDRSIRKVIISYETKQVIQNIKTKTVTILLIDGAIALIIGYLFSRQLTRPLNTIIDGIQRLANKDYNINYEPKGLYKDVFYNVNHLSHQLTINKREKNKLDQMREEWISNISHDIKTPLASIQGYAEIIKDKDYDLSLDVIRDYAQIIESKSLYIKEVMEDLNLTTRLKNNDLTLNRKNINLVSLIRDTLIDILNDSRFADKTIEFNASQENILINLDIILMRRAISNLILNALVHNDSNVKIVVHLEKKERTHITIKDNGKGIEKKEVDKIFDRYFRGTNTGTLHKGSGLGMAIAKDIIQKHDGEIVINSTVGKGTSIHIKL